MYIAKMPKHDSDVNGCMSGNCKVRKRGCLTSSSSSTIMRSHRFKRAIMVARKGGSTTPVPRWKVNARSPSYRSGLCESSHHQPSYVVREKVCHGPISARKLANALWEMNKSPPLKWSGESQYKDLKKGTLRRSSTERVALPPHLPHPSHSPVSDISGRSRSSNNQRRLVHVFRRKFHYKDHDRKAHENSRIVNLTETDTCSEVLTPTSSVSEVKNLLKDLRNTLLTSKELLQVLNHVSRCEEQQTYSAPVVTALNTELHRIHLLLDQLIRDYMLDHTDINYTKKGLGKMKTGWRNNEKVKFTDCINSVIEELELEKKLRARAERLNKSLGLELSNMKTLLLKTTKDMENERRTRDVFEQVCNEMMRGMREDKAEVERMKRESTKAREELEKEREMLQLADVWREERVQMKLSEAKLHYEEKNAAVEQLRYEFEAFLSAKKAKKIKSDLDDKGPEANASGKRHGEQKIQNMKIDNDCEDDDGMKSTDSELHLIELDMEGNNRSFDHNYSAISNFDESNEVASSSKGKMTRDIFCLDREKLEEITWNLEPNHDQPRTSHRRYTVHKDYEAQMLDKDAEIYATVKGLRDSMLADSRLTAVTTSASPTYKCSRYQKLGHDDDQTRSLLSN